MDHRIIQIDALLVLLDRLEDDEPNGWQVLISCFMAIDLRFDEWIIFENPYAARQFINDFSELSAKQFLSRAQNWLEVIER